MPDKQCLCGSGKNKGSCCGNNNNIIDINKYRRWRTGQLLRRKLAEFADSEIFAEEMELARELYFSVMDPDLVDEKDDFLMERFFEWFIFDYRIRGRSVLDYFGMTGGLSEEEKAMLNKWKHARSSAYLVLQVDENCVLTLRDIIRERDTLVQDRQAACEVEPGQILFIRVLPLGEENEFSTGGLILPGYSYEYVLERIRMDAELYWSKQGRRRNWDAYLRDRAHAVNAMVMEMGALWELSEEGWNGESGPAREKEAGQPATDSFLDYFYERWINEPMVLLKGKTPLEAYKTKSGREKLQDLLLGLEHLERESGEPRLDLSRLWNKLQVEHEASTSRNGGKNTTTGENNGDGGVVELIRDGLIKMGYRGQHVNTAVDMWHKYNNLARPTFRKPGAWAAAVIYALAKSQGNDSVSQNDLALMFNVSVSSISNNYSSIRRTLQLDGLN